MGKDEHIELIWTSCPRCGRHFAVSRTGGPQQEIHRNRGGKGFGGRACRWIVHPDPADGSLRLEKVPDDVRAEDLLEIRRRQWEEEHGLVEHLTRDRGG